MSTYDERLKAVDCDWSGDLTIENAPAVAERIRALIGSGQRYTWVAVNEYFGDRPEVRTGQVAKEVRQDVSGPYDDGERCAHIIVSDTYGSWGLHTGAASTTHARQMRDADERDWVLLEFTCNKIVMQHHAPAGNRLFWVVAVEDEREADL